ncbi:MAG: hypothetical protein DVB29_00220 [Verrucomicrobia bacterium]|nr:MAG: hypothetical protein DVB29_00220 [Verrucomicrobiota bacterium]
MDISERTSLLGQHSLVEGSNVPKNSTKSNEVSNGQETTECLRKDSVSFNEEVTVFRYTPLSNVDPSAVQGGDNQSVSENRVETQPLKGPTEKLSRVGLFLEKLKTAKKSFWKDCSAKKLSSEATQASKLVQDLADQNKEASELSKKDKKELLPYSSLWTTPIVESLSKSETRLSHDYSVTTTPKNDGKKGVCKRDDEHSMNAWSSVLERAGGDEASQEQNSEVQNNKGSSGAKKRIFASLRCAAWIPTSSSLGSTLARQVTRFTTWMGYKPPGEQRLKDNLTSVLELQAGDPESEIAKCLNTNDSSEEAVSARNVHGEGTRDNPLKLSMLSNSLVSGCMMGGTDPEGYLQDMQLRLIDYANKSEEPFELKTTIKGEEKTVFVKPDILMLSSPVQSKDRWLMRWSCGLLGVRNHSSNMETVAKLEGKHSDYKHKQLSKLDTLIKGGKTEAAAELALNIKADQELMDEILEMARNPKDLEKGMYGDNYGNPHAFNARMSVLASRMGITPINNCKTGKDRTEDSEAAQKLLASEIDENIQSKVNELLYPFESKGEKIFNELESENGISIPSTKPKIDNDYCKRLIYSKDFQLVPKRDFLSAENLKKEIKALGIDGNDLNGIAKAIDAYSLGKPSQKNLFTTIRNFYKRKEIPDNLKKLLTQFEQTAQRRKAFGFSEAGFTIQMLNNKTSLLWGNKQERYPEYLFGLSSEEIEGYSKLMKPQGKVKA